MSSLKPGCDCVVAFPGNSEANCGGATIFTFMVILESFLRRQCDIEDPCGHITPRLEPEPEYDFIVCGLGSAGSVVANRLSEVEGWKVLGVEAGGNEPTMQQVPSLYANAIGTSFDWQYMTEPQEGACLNTGGSCSWPRGKGCGGTSVFNCMLYVRGSRSDFDQWEERGCTGWGYEDVLPYYLKSENNLELDEMDQGYHRQGGYLPVTRFSYSYQIEKNIKEGFKELGLSDIDINGKTRTGFTTYQTTSSNGVRYSSCRSFLRPVKSRSNLHIMLKTLVTRVLVNHVTKRAYGVEVLTPEGKIKRILARKEVILSGGAINSPQILLLSGIGDKEDLEKVNVPVTHHLPGVGKNLHNHVGYMVKFTIDDIAKNDLNWAVAMEYLLYRKGPMSTTGISLTGFIKSRYADVLEDNPDIQIVFSGYDALCSQTGAINEFYGRPINGSRPKRVIYMVLEALQTKSKGYLTLRDNNPESYPKIFPNYLTVREDLDTLIDGIRFAIELSETEALQKVGFKLNKTPEIGCEGISFNSDEYWECAIRRNTFPVNHQAGSCKMGPLTDPLAVVDPELQVHGLEGLSVMDTSIMPQVTSGNTHAPAVMIAEKGSDMVKKRWLQTS